MILVFFLGGEKARIRPSPHPLGSGYATAGVGRTVWRSIGCTFSAIVRADREFIARLIRRENNSLRGWLGRGQQLGGP